MNDEVITPKQEDVENVVVVSGQATLAEGTTGKYKDTVFKSAYYHGQHMLNFFLNYDTPQAPKAFSILIKKGKFMTVYNLTEGEKMSFAKAVLNELTPGELSVLLASSSKE